VGVRWGYFLTAIKPAMVLEKDLKQIMRKKAEKKSWKRNC
jgi:hypothetical protein